METASTEVTSIWRRNDIEKSTWRTHRYFVDFESRIHVEISTSNRCHNFHVDSPFKIDVVYTNFPRGISTSNRWRMTKICPLGNNISSKLSVTFPYKEAVVRRCSIKKVFLEILQNSQENSYAGDPFLIKLQTCGLQLY